MECGSGWFLHVHHSGCQAWLDGMRHVVFVFVALSVTLIPGVLVQTTASVEFAQDLLHEPRPHVNVGMWPGTVPKLT